MVYPPAEKEKEIKCALLFGYTSLYISAPKGQKKATLHIT